MIDFYRIFMPNHWIRFWPTTDEIDKLVNKLINDDATVKSMGACTTKVGNFIFWTANYPYAYGVIDGKSYFGMPKANTVRKFRKFINTKLIDEINLTSS